MTHLILNIQLALRSIKANMLRSILTFMIIAIGIMALVGILTAVDSIKGSISENLGSLGANTFTIRSKGLNFRGGQKGDKNYPPVLYDDARMFKQRFAYPSIVSITTTGSNTATISSGYEKTNPNVKVLGVDENYIKLSGYEMERGRNFSLHETMSGSNVTIVGAGLADKIFHKNDSIVGQYIMVGNIRYLVVGMLKAKGSSMMNNDNLALIPEQNARQEFHRAINRYVISIAVDDPKKLDVAVAESEGTFRIIRRLSPLEDDDFEVVRSDKLANTVIEQLSKVTIAATIIGIITLLGAGIGLMNIMLVSVSERTHEIGISKAIGATRRNIIVQFLVETIVICQIGGALGILFGILAGNVVSLLLKASFLIPWLWILGGFIFCFIIGLLAGIYPALKASRLDPIEALRYE